LDFRFKPEEEQIITEVRDFLQREITAELLAEQAEYRTVSGGPEYRKLLRKIGEKGWLCPTWSEEYGGLESSYMVKFGIVDVMSYMGVPEANIAVAIVGPTLDRYGNEDMKNRLLPPIARGEVEYCAGYTEPQAGSDLSAIEMRAEDRGDYFLVNGQKMFNSHAHVAEYHWLLTRTEMNPDVPKRKSMSLMVVDLKSPGITIRPLIAMDGTRTNEVFYDNVKVPKDNLVGELNRGFSYVMKALEFERMFPVGYGRRLLEELMSYCRKTKQDGRILGKDPVIRQMLTQLAMEMEIQELLYYRLAHSLDTGTVASYEASMQKVLFSELTCRLADTATQILGPSSQLQKGSKWAPLDGVFELYYRWGFIITIAGGANEIQRNIIALRGLGLPLY
jgi:alkylation response protein AidB-like acyl-CoA dehydrogenase